MNIFSMTFILSSLLKFDNVSENKMNIIRNDYIQYITRVVNDANENYNNVYIYDSIKTRFYVENIHMYNDHSEQFMTESDIEPIPDAIIIPVEDEEEEGEEEDHNDNDDNDNYVDVDVDVDVEVEVEITVNEHKEL